MALKVIVVGAGIAGLCTAIALRRAGLDVEIFEKSAFATEVGAALSVTPNGSRVLSHLGFSFERARGCKMQTWKSLIGKNLDCVGTIDLGAAEKKFGSAVWTIHRIDLHSELLRLATTANIDGSKPAVLRLSSQVVDADVNGSVTLSDGSKHTADLVVAADGLHSVLRKKVLVKTYRSPSESGMSAFRFLIETKALLDEPDLAPLLAAKGDQNAAILIDPEEKASERHIMWYPCRNGETQNFVGVHPTRKEDLEETSEKDMKTSMLKEFSHYDEGVVRVIQKSSHVKCWPLYIHDPISNWFKGGIVLVGDAAHPMLPFGGQGSNQAMEDAAALGFMLTNLNDNTDEIASRLGMFEKVRQKRAARVQTLSKSRLGRESEISEELKAYADPPGSSVPTTPQERTFHDYSFDVFAKCEEVLREHQNGRV